MALSNRDLRVLLTTIANRGLREEDLVQALKHRFAQVDIRLGIQQLLNQQLITFNSKRQLLRTNRQG